MTHRQFQAILRCLARIVSTVLIATLLGPSAAHASNVAYRQNLVNSTGFGNGDVKYLVSGNGAFAVHAFLFQQQIGPCLPTPSDIGFAFYLGGQLTNYFYAQQCDGPWSGDGQYHWTMYNFVGNSPCDNIRAFCNTFSPGDWLANNFFILGGGGGGGAYTDPQGHVTPALILQDDTALPPDPLGLPITFTHGDSLILQDSSTVWTGGTSFVGGTLGPVSLSPPSTAYTAPHAFEISRIHIGANNDFSLNNHDLVGNMGAFIHDSAGNLVSGSTNTCYVEGGCTGADLLFAPGTQVPANFTVSLVALDGVQGNASYNVLNLGFFAEKPHPSLSNLGQFTPDGITAISEGGTTSGGAISFKAMVQSASTDPLVLQVEVQPTATPFLNILSGSSIVITSGHTATATLTGLASGQYRWQARVVDLTNLIASPWQEFGNAAGVDFILSAQLPPLNGTISVATNEPGATFTVSDGSGHTFAGNGTTFTQTAPAGTYTATFGDVQGFRTPDSETLILSGGGTVNFLGTYIPLPPKNLHATVGNASVHLDWAPSPAPDINGYNVYIEQFVTDHFVALGTVNAVGVPLVGTNLAVTGQFSEGKITNETLYRFQVTTLKDNLESQRSEAVLARPGQFAINPPSGPILFLHGITDRSTTWNTVKTFLEETACWKFGGVLSYRADQNPASALSSPAQLDLPLPGQEIGNNCPFRIDPNFFTADFGSPTADYPPQAGRNGIRHQADEVAGFVQRIKELVPKKVILVAHSMGGLAARTYIAEHIDSNQNVSDLITYGTPHWGVPDSDQRIVTPFLFLFFKAILSTQGLKDMTVGCSAFGHLDYSTNDFLNWLRAQPLDTHIAYSTIRGNSLFIPSPCLGSDDDIAVRIESAILSVPMGAPADQITIVAGPKLPLTTNKLHMQETADIPSILCMLDSNCLLVKVHSPVDLEITAPDGHSITRNLTEIPGASYMAVPEDNGGTSATVIIPFPQSGTYSVKAVPKPDALPTDVYTLDVTRAGVTTIIAQNQSVQNIPPQPYAVPVLAPVNLDIKPGDNPKKIELRSRGKIRVAILSTPGLNAPARIDRSTLTFGHFGDEQSLAFCENSAEDVNGDGLPDLVCHFFTQKTGFVANDVIGTLKGNTKDGVPFVGTGPVTIVP